MGQLMWVRMLPGDSTEDATRGVSTAESGGVSLRPISEGVTGV